MTAVALLDVLTNSQRSDAEPHAPKQVADFATRLVERALNDWEQVLGYEKQFSSAEYNMPETEDQINRVLYSIYGQWADEARQVLHRTQALMAAGCRIKNAQALEDAFARATARLKLTPEMIARATQQAREGRGIPMREMRDELRARIRA